MWYNFILMKYQVRKNWWNSLGLIISKPIVLLPFVVFAFVEGLALELIYFSSRKPISTLTAPIVRKFFGEKLLHYPNDLIILPEFLYYAQLVIYVFISVFLIAIGINVFKNLKTNLPLKVNALVRNAAKRYGSFVVYGIFVITAVLLLRKLDTVILIKIFKLASKEFPNAVTNAGPFIAPIFLFITNLILQVFLVLTLPIMVMQKKSFSKALGKSIIVGARNFLSLFTLILIPYLIYFPVALLRSFSGKLAALTFPEINVVIAGIAIIVSMFADCFIIVCASQFLLDTEEVK